MLRKKSKSLKKRKGKWRKKNDSKKKDWERKNYLNKERYNFWMMKLTKMIIRLNSHQIEVSDLGNEKQQFRWW
jgi:hypothetical protein